MSYNLLSLADYPSISTVVYLDRLKFQKSASKWKLIESFASSNSPFAIELESGESLVDLAPLIGGAGSFAVYGGLATKAFAGKMAYIFNTRHLVAKLYSKESILLESAKKVGSAVNGNVIILALKNLC